MNAAEEAVLNALPPPDCAGYSEATILRIGFRDGIAESAVLASLQGLVVMGYVEAVDGHCRRYRQTRRGAAAIRGMREEEDDQ